MILPSITTRQYIAEFGFAPPEEAIRTDLAYVLDDADRVSKYLSASNSCSSLSSQFSDYYMTMLGEVLLAINEDHIPLAGTFAWGKSINNVSNSKQPADHESFSALLAMVDNAEWSSGKSTRFGIQYVNYTTLERHFKRSALALCTHPG
jgi:hypothetical protein